MTSYNGYDHPYITVMFPEELSEETMHSLDALEASGVRFHLLGKDSVRKSHKRLDGAHAALFFVNSAFLKDEAFRRTIDDAVRLGKNTLLVYCDDARTYMNDPGAFDVWAQMQLNSSQAVFRNDYATEDAFLAKLKEAGIFREMAVTKQQKKYKKNSTLTAVLIPIVAAALIFGLVVYPLLIAPAVQA